MTQFASKVPWFINSATQGNRRLVGLQDWSVEDGGSTETVNEVGSADPVGHVTKPGNIGISLTEKIVEGVPTVDWVALRDSRELFSMTRQVENGQRTQYLDCRVSTVNESGDAEAENTREVSIVALRRKAL